MALNASPNFGILFQQDPDNLVQSFGQAFQLGNAMSVAQQQRKDAELANQINNERLNAEKMKNAESMQMRQDLNDYMANPNPSSDDTFKLFARYPALSDHYTKAFALRNAEQQKADLNTMTEITSALASDKPDIAHQVIDSKIEAFENAGKTEDAAKLKTLKQVIAANPKAALRSSMLYVAANIGKEGFNNFLGALTTPETISKAESEASSAKVDADFAELRQKSKLLTEENQRRVAELDAQIKAAGSETERGKLQLEQQKLLQELSKNQKADEVAATNTADTVSQGLDTVAKIKAHPALSSSIGVGSSIGALLGKVPGTENTDFNSLLETLKSQQFLNMIPVLKGTGNLTDAEGAKLMTAIASLDRNQSPASFKAALATIENTLTRQQRRIASAGNLPTGGTNATFVMNHPKYGTVTDSTVNAIVNKNPGATRDQVLKYLYSTGGK